MRRVITLYMVRRCFTSTETVWLINRLGRVEGDSAGTRISLFTQILNSDVLSSETLPFLKMQDIAVTKTMVMTMWSLQSLSLQKAISGFLERAKGQSSGAV